MSGACKIYTELFLLVHVLSTLPRKKTRNQPLELLYKICSSSNKFEANLNLWFLLLASWLVFRFHWTPGILILQRSFSFFSYFKKLPSCLQLMSQESFILSKCFSNFNSHSILQAFLNTFRRLQKIIQKCNLYQWLKTAHHKFLSLNSVT